MSVQEATQQQAAKAAKPQVAKAAPSPFATPATTQPTPAQSSTDAQPEKKKYVPEPLTEDQAMSRCRNVLDRVSARTALRVAAYLTQRAQDAVADEAATAGTAQRA